MRELRTDIILKKRWILSFLHVGDSVLLPFVVAVGVLLQNLIFIGTIATLETNSRFYSAAVNTVTVQVLWAIITGPILLLFFKPPELLQFQVAADIAMLSQKTLKAYESGFQHDLCPATDLFF